MKGGCREKLYPSFFHKKIHIKNNNSIFIKNNRTVYGAVRLFLVYKTDSAEPLRGRMCFPDRRKSAGSSAMYFLHQLCFIDHELEVKAEGLGCLFAELHSFEKDLEVVHYRAELGVN